MNIYNYIKNDHKKVDEIFEKIINTSQAGAQKNLFQELKNELIIHADSEHATFYKELKKHSEIKDLIKHADQEHKEVKDFLAILDTLKVGSAQWLVKLGELKHAVEHHVHEEESEIFKESKKVLNKEIEKKLVDDMDAAKKKD